jgi:hypothetical protein
MARLTDDGNGICEQLMVNFILLRLMLLNHAFIHPDAKRDTIFAKWSHTGSCVAVDM